MRKVSDIARTTCYILAGRSERGVFAMSLEEHEIPGRQRGVELAPEDITLTNRPVYLLVIAGLFLALLFGLVAWFVLTVRGESMPEGMAVLVGTIGGGLVGLVTGAKT